ncbi:RpiR family transcriptional regulator [Butyricicoccus pullicaecorum]|uniref:RpiR family transcriptional regulator n=1 Tax=Butyricicoccus pullicaecorum TaxID=501571 RepID=A0A1Y4L6Y3_9FIRM|nr:MurR/RpiR family transcriptional regulator [Butyricicoccus pullicaecorum]OUP52504.1 RpiR family transcriptional regulator [Butyricicoccus pullicaecorum]
MELQLPISASELTRAEQKILDFINTNTDTFLFLSIGQLAKRLEISDATLSRFARHAGCRDFKALKTLVMEQASGPAVKIAGTLHREEHFSPVGFLQQQQLYLQKTAEQLDEATFDRAAQTIAQAKRILIYGKKASSSLAQLIYFRLRRLGLQVSLLPSGGSELLEGLGQIGEGDLVILFSFSKLSREGKILLEQGRRAGYQTLAFVSRTCLPPEESADMNLFVYRGTEKEYHSMAAPTALLDALVVAVTKQMGADGVAALKTLHELKKTYFLDS